MPARAKKSIRDKVKLKHLSTSNTLFEKHPHVKKYFDKKGLDPGKLRTHSAKLLGAGAMAGSMLLTAPHTLQALPSPDDLMLPRTTDAANKSSSDLLVATLKSVLPSEVRPLGRDEEKLLEKVFENMIGVKAKATLEGEHLNTTYGKIGAEQHLKRFPGDELFMHSEDEDVLRSGIAPGLGAWGYFAPSRDRMTPELVNKEKWYAVVQTLYLPDWNTRQPYLKDWYKHRKVLIVNTQNGRAVVASIADSGPAAFTGKHYGGSPEVMNYLGGVKYKKGPVIVFFVDDPENKVPLGPVTYEGEKELTSMIKPL